MVFGLLKDKLSGASRRIEGKTDFLEGAGAAMAFAAMPGGISQEEYDAGIEAAMNSEVLTAAFKPHVIETVVGRMFDKARKDTFSARAALLKEIKEAAAKLPEEKITMLYCAMDAVSSDGTVDDAEFKQLQEIAKITGGNPGELLGR